MTIDYDVVIIGGSIVGRYAAMNAAQQRANVALVEPSSLDDGFVYHHAFGSITNRLRQTLQNARFGIHLISTSLSEKCQISLGWEEAALYAKSIAANITEQLSPAILGAAGVDVISGSGHFQGSQARRPGDLAFIVNNRLLSARHYLLATGSTPAIPAIEGLQSVGYLTLSNIWHSLNSSANSHTPPQNWVIIGGVPQSIELAQILARLGFRVALILSRPYLLPNLDPEISALLQAQLEIEGVRVLTQTAVTQVMRIENKKWVQAGDKAIEADEIVVATGQQANLDSLNLPTVGVKWHPGRLLVNNKLQTTNQRIYACGDVIGGYDFVNVAKYEAKIAIDNALFFPTRKVNYNSVPWALFTQPMLAQVGLSEKQAKSQYGNDEILVLRQYFKSLTAAQITDETTGICKLIVKRNGEVLGGSLLGKESGELINIIALAIAQKIKAKHLANLSTVYPSFAEILQQTALEWNQQKLSNFGLQEFLDDFFLFRRGW
ncbi:MAG: NAD(P)/FAD-dependent oxidoreductase [Scytonematopsis contorta HA4267-MV1]|jgi:pyruvate/2-oxoglutarate dehydrogenase complex dihydrolipoamide dehydrogenase (E3) component|nr:NAD(P)/FAD-dependent oxidoreductase [Scytonematopsis contorta HA4267-MV1]